MPTKKEIEELEEKKRRETDRLAQQQAVEQVNINEEPSYVEPADMAEESPFVTDVDSVMKETEVFNSNATNPEKASAEDLSAGNEAVLSDEDEYALEVSNSKFQSFLAAEMEEVNKKIEAMKKAHANDYDAYVESLRKTDYYKKCLAKWQKYYADKKQEFENEAKAEAELINAEAKAQAANFASKEAQVVMQQKAQKVFEKPKESAPKANDQNFVSSSEKNYTIDSSNLKLDPDLLDTVEQILLHDLKDSLDEYRDFYTTEKTRNNETSNKKMTVAMNKITDARLELLQKLVNSFEEIIDTTGNQTYWDLSQSNVKGMRKKIKAKEGQMDMSSVADTTIYSLLVNDENSNGIILDLAKYLTLKIQEELISEGKLGNFNLFKDHAYNVISDIVKNFDTLSKIRLSNENSLVVNNLYKELIDMNSKFTKDVKDSLNNFNKGKVDEFINAIEYIDYLSNENNEELINVLKEESETLKNIIDCRDTVDQKTVLKMLDSQKQKLVNSNDYSYRSNKNSYEHFDKHSGKKLSTRPIIDKLLFDLIQKVGAENSKGKLEEFVITKNYKEQELESLINYVDSNKNKKINLSEDYLTDVLLDRHDLREKYKTKHTSKSIEAQEELDLLGELLNSEYFDATKYINEKLEKSIESSKGKQRKKHIRLKEEEKTL